MKSTALDSPSSAAADAPEYERPDGISRRFSIPRTTVFELLRKGRIKSLSLKSRASCVRGRRLILVASVREYFESLTTTPATN